MTAIGMPIMVKRVDRCGGVGLTWIAAAALLFAGCSDSGLTTYRAGGKVVFSDGTPLPGGTVEFKSVDHEPSVGARGTIESDGTFRLGTMSEDDGAVEGKHLAVVMPPMLKVDRDEIRGPVPEPIDPKFQQFLESGLEFVVSSDESKNDFVITVHPPE